MNLGNGGSAFSAFRHRNFLYYWTSLLVSNTGNQMQIVATNWQVYQITHSPFALGLIGFFRIFPIVIFSLIGGVLADAMDRRKIIFIAEFVMMLSSFLLGIITLAGNVPVWTIYLLTAVNAAAFAFDTPARHSLVPNLVPEKELSHAVTLNNTQYQSATIFGPVVTGFLIASTNIGNIYLINTVSFLTVLIAMLHINIKRKETALHLISFKSLKEGFHFVFRHNLIRSGMLLDFFATFFASAATMMPIFATDILKVGPEGLGILYAAPAIGAVAAGIFFSLFPHIPKKGLLLLASAFIFGLATVFFGISNIFLLSLFFLAVTGAADTLSSIIRHTLRQLVTPDHLRGRMNAISMIFFMGGPQLGEVEAGIAAGMFGAPFSVVIGGIGTMAVTAYITLRNKALRNYQ